MLSSFERRFEAMSFAPLTPQKKERHRRTQRFMYCFREERENDEGKYAALLFHTVPRTVSATLLSFTSELRRE
jgi:hypothetical protein|tara:strand:+ start:601 stop:819 length:219 start_codon:yes stop_codon:yes gene_type:complete